MLSHYYSVSVNLGVAFKSLARPLVFIVQIPTVHVHVPLPKNSN